ncbi:hypothetical protein DL95DRAFT_453044 [Leptodontidium sp. 2 PMI_412]|nr:hypothetical protein DL95DRAFT_453044 [Leptodontidium sp. 2 PMI_412]
MSNFHFRLWTQVHGYQNNTYGCGNVEAGFSVTETQLLSWNTWIGSDCDTGLYANLAYGGIRAICIGLGGSSPTSTTSSSSTSTTFTMGPIPTDTISGWQEFYTVQPNDGCQTIFDKFSITQSQFYSWNPSANVQTFGLARHTAFKGLLQQAQRL